MFKPDELARVIASGGWDAALGQLYPQGQLADQRERYVNALQSFVKRFGEDRDVAVFSAPGRTEIGGNHTDHQHGRVLAAAVNLDILCIAAKNSDSIIRVHSKGFHENIVRLDNLTPQEEETGHAPSLIRGVAARFAGLGLAIGGFDAYTTSDVLKGSGLSSSAAFEVALGTMLSRLYNGNSLDAMTIAQIGQYAENVYFGKPSGLMDQAAASVGGFVMFDFLDPDCPVAEPVRFDFSASGHTLCIVDTRASHSDLTPDYAAIPAEMKGVAAFFGKAVLREVDEAAFYVSLDKLRAAVGERAVLRAMHFFGDNARVPQQAGALRRGDFDAFKRLITESGRSSRDMLQNVFSPGNPREQGLSLALSLSERLLGGKGGAWRVHGGGFAGTIQAFVPDGLLESYRSAMENVFGAGSCHGLAIRNSGGIELTEGGTICGASRPAAHI
jgi:galactokinase